MKRILLRASVLVLVGCADHTAELSAIDAARARWHARQTTCATYHYNRAQPPGGVGPRDITTVQIEDGTVAWRWYVSASSFPDAGPGVQFIERGAELGTHPQGYPASTVDELLDECRSVVASAGDDSVTLTLNEAGIPETCLATPRDCTGDCSRGVTLSLFKCAAIEPRGGSTPDGGAQDR